MEFLISYQCGWWAVRAREFTVVAATTTSTPIWWITTGNNGSGQNEAAAAANLLLQTCLRPFHSIFSDKFLRRHLFFGLHNHFLKSVRLFRPPPYTLLNTDWKHSNQAISDQHFFWAKTMKFKNLNWFALNLKNANQI